MFFRGISFIVLCLFVTWIFPLGVFVDPDQDQKLCNKRRPVCLCRKFIENIEHQGLLAKQDSFKKFNRSSQQKQSGSSSSPEFLHSIFVYPLDNKISFFIHQSLVFYIDPIIFFIDPVPKV